MLSSAYKIVTPGESIGPQEGYLRGHGTYTENNRTLVASVCGVVERVNKLVKVDPLQSRYRGDVGDLVVGRVEEVGEKSWKVDVGGAKSAVLMLSSVRLFARDLLTQNSSCVSCCSPSVFGSVHHACVSTLMHTYELSFWLELSF